MFKSIMFVCIGNICRSPFAEGLMKKYSDKYNLGLDVDSAGIGALVASPPHRHSVDIIKMNHGIDILQNKAKQIDQGLIVKNELILGLDDLVTRELVNRYPFARGKIKKISFLNGNRDIVDPYRKDKEAFIQMSIDIEQCIVSLLKDIWMINLDNH